MLDIAKLKLIAGDGGNGRISFRREKYVAKGGPDGGIGGDGGSIIVRGKRGLSTLNKYAGVVSVEAKNGKPGGAKKMSGSKAEDEVMEVPLGTVIWAVGGNKVANRRSSYFGGVNQVFRRGDVEFEKFFVEKEGQAAPPREGNEVDDFGYDGVSVSVSAQAPVSAQAQAPTIAPVRSNGVGDEKKIERKIKLAEILEDGQEVVLCQGGFGGRGNTSFKGSTNTTPLEAEYGTFGERRQVILELKLLADVGLVGFPNAGKSTLLSKITRANPKIANYPFTTLEPNLGVMSFMGDKSGKKELVVADIPGLIEGASMGKGLGLDFLRHVENCRVLMFVLYLDESVVFDESISEEEKAKTVLKQYNDLQKELTNYHPDLAKKPFILTLNKIDIYTSKLIDAIRSIFNEQNMVLMPFSGVSGEGLEEVEKKLREVVS